MRKFFVSFLFLLYPIVGYAEFRYSPTGTHWSKEPRTSVKSNYVDAGYRNWQISQMEQNYKSQTALSDTLRGSTGAVSNTVVRGRATQTVAKRTVMQNLLANARRGGRFLGRGGLGGIAAGYVLEAAYDLVKEKLAEKGYKWDDKEGDFVNPQEYTVECQSIFDAQKYGRDPEKNYGYKPCGGISSYGRNMPDVAKSVYTSICQTQEVAGS